MFLFSCYSVVDSDVNFGRQAPMHRHEGSKVGD